jgi:alpha-ketoglutarate-dependent 2,4-dichlorophenoxyacetate dioxygenase
MAMVWNERRLTPGFGIELSGQRIDGTLSQAERTAVYDAVMRYGVVVVSGQSLSDEAYLEFAESIGEVNPTPNVEGVPASRVLPISNVDAEGRHLPPDDWWVRQNMANELWHTDLTFMRPRATVSLLYGREVPPIGGNTEFCDLRLAYEALSPAEQTRLDGLTGHHSIMHSRATYGFDEWSREEQKRFPPIPRSLVALHEGSGRKALLLASHIETIDGYDAVATAALVRDLMARVTAPENCYAHRWSEGDLLLWDNRCVMHRATPFDLANHRRDMRALRLIDLADA